MAECLPVILLVAFTLLCLIGAVGCTVHAVCSFIAKQYWLGLKSLTVGVLLSLALLVMFPCPQYGLREKARRTGCIHNLSELMKLGKVFAGDHGGRYPVSFDELAGGYLKADDLPIFTCRFPGHKAGNPTNIHSWTDYAYVSGLRDADTSNCVVIFCAPVNHKDEGAVVGFLDGTVQWVPCREEKSTSATNKMFTFRELTNTPALFYGTSDEIVLAGLKKRTKVIYPLRRK